MTAYQSGAHCVSCGVFVPYSNLPHRCTPPDQPRFAPIQYQYPSIWQNPCDHCFCRPSIETPRQVGPHRECCKCSTDMAEQFINLGERES